MKPILMSTIIESKNVNNITSIRRALIEYKYELDKILENPSVSSNLDKLNDREELSFIIGMSQFVTGPNPETYEENGLDYDPSLHHFLLQVKKNGWSEWLLGEEFVQHISMMKKLSEKGSDALGTKEVRNDFMPTHILSGLWLSDLTELSVQVTASVYVSEAYLKAIRGVSRETLVNLSLRPRILSDYGICTIKSMDVLLEVLEDVPTSSKPEKTRGISWFKRRLKKES